MKPAQEKRDNDLRLILSPELWPASPYLPLIRRVAGSGFPDLGVLQRTATDGPDDPYTIYGVNLFTMAWTKRPWPVLDTYSTAQKLLDAGWRVD